MSTAFSSDSDDEDLPTGGAVGELDLATEATPSDLASDPAHTHSRKMLYSVLLKDALLKHVSTFYFSTINIVCIFFEDKCYNFNFEILFMLNICEIKYLK